MESGHFENGVKVKDLTLEEVEELRLDHLQEDVDQEEKDLAEEYELGND